MLACTQLLRSLQTLTVTAEGEGGAGTPRGPSSSKRLRREALHARKRPSWWELPRRTVLNQSWENLQHWRLHLNGTRGWGTDPSHISSSFRGRWLRTPVQSLANVLSQVCLAQLRFCGSCWAWMKGSPPPSSRSLATWPGLTPSPRAETLQSHRLSGPRDPGVRLTQSWI